MRKIQCEIVEKHRPICIAKDGIELVDDVGGIRGFCDRLKTIYETDLDDDKEMEEGDSMPGWAEMMGWTGRKIRPETEQEERTGRKNSWNAGRE